MSPFSKKNIPETNTKSDSQLLQQATPPLVKALKRRLEAGTPAERMAVGGKEMLSYLTHALARSDPQGVRIEDMLCILGSLCGYSCQIAELSDIKSHKDSPAGFMVVKYKDGSTAFMGAALLEKIFSAGNSPWSLIGGGAQRIGKLDEFKNFNVEELIKHSAEVVNKPEYGVIRVESRHQPRLRPQEWLEKLWTPYSEHLAGLVSSQSDWPACFGVAIQEAMVMAKDKIDARVAITIVIESMLTTSKFVLKPNPSVLTNPDIQIDQKATADISARISAIYASSKDPMEWKRQFIAADRDTRTVAAGAEVFKAFSRKMADQDKTIHLPEMYSILGSLAGFSCQASMRIELVKNRGWKEGDAFTQVTTKDGRVAFTGDAVDKGIVEYIWPETVTTIKQLGGVESLDMDEVFGHFASTIMSEEYNVLRVPAKYRPQEATPDRYAGVLFPECLKVLIMYTDEPLEWPIIFTIAIRDALQTFKTELDLKVAETLILESAVIASKIDIRNYAVGKAPTTKSRRGFRQLVAHNYSTWWQDRKT